MKCIKTLPTAGAWVCLLSLLIAGGAQARTLSVGPGEKFVFPSVAAQFAEDGDVIEIDAAGHYLNDHVVWKQDNLTIRGVNGRPHIRNQVKIPNGKGIWVIKGDNVSIANVEMSGAKVGDRNGAAIRLEGSNFRLSDCYIHDNENGVLGGVKDTASEVVIENCEFAFNGRGKHGRTHNIYIGHVGRFILRDSYSHDAIVGHLVKSRAEENYILYNRLFEGMASYAVDLPNGGYGLVMGNIIYQGENTDNWAMVAYGQKNLAHPKKRLDVIYNSFLNERSSTAYVTAKGDAEVNVMNNLFSGHGHIFQGGKQGGSVDNNVHEDKLYDGFSAAGVTLVPDRREDVVDAAKPVMGPDGKELVPEKQMVDNVLVERKRQGRALDIGAVEYQ